MVFAPALLCDRARCRRHRRCSLPGTTEPDLKEGVSPPITMYPRCLLTAPTEVIQEFLTILGVAMHLKKRLVPGLLRLLADASEDSPFRAQNNAIYAILESRLPRGDPLKAEFQDFWRREAVRSEE
ncbi:hypothetical protein LRX75_21850 [Rhizobium sp. DKSPLA3]|uniref:Uncharacterized protein n=1 Tax=Rhizobium quercicola TaxID=2901226 RepID=A0A9X1NXV4_9HYPH|nr:hypothetical protein [Rhizobium quercicola]MCD7111679.1 hypothetical protein [Rhizobium quercicola]